MNRKQKSQVWNIVMGSIPKKLSFGEKLLIASETAKALGMSVLHDDTHIELRATSRNTFAGKMLAFYKY